MLKLNYINIYNDPQAISSLVGVVDDKGVQKIGVWHKVVI